MLGEGLPGMFDSHGVVYHHAYADMFITVHAIIKALQGEAICGDIVIRLRRLPGYVHLPVVRGVLFD